MSENDKPYFELDLAAYLDADGLHTLPIADLPAGEVLDALKADYFAEVNVPYHTQDAHYCYIFHLLNKLQDEIALAEAFLIQAIIKGIHDQWHHRCQQIS